MALAIITYEGNNAAGFLFTADTGTNSFYKYIIGKAKTTKNGLSLIEEITHESAVLRSDPVNIFDTSFSILIPRNLLNNNLSYVQLISYKDMDLRSPAFSEVKLLFATADVNPGALPVLELSKSVKMRSSPTSGCRSVSFNYKSTPISKREYWNTLVESLSYIKKRNIAGKDTRQIIDVIKKATEKLHQHSLEGAPLPKEEIWGKNTSSGERMKLFTTSLSFTSIEGKRQDIVQTFRKNEKDVHINKKVKPPVLASLFSPLLQQSPGLFAVNMDSPMKMINALAERKYALKEFDDDYFNQLLSDSSRKALLEEYIHDGAVAEIVKPVGLSFLASNKLSIDFIQNDPVIVQGRPKYIYKPSPGIQLMLSVKNSDQENLSVIPKVIIQLMIKDSASLKLLLEKKFKLKDIALDAEIPLQVSKNELDRLPKNKDLLVSAKFVWQSNETTENVGTFSNHFIFLSEGYFLKEVKAAVSEEKPLHDRVLHGNFWHKVWEGGGNNKRWQLELDTKYLCIYKYDKDTNGRIETRLQVDKDQEADQTRLKIIGKMKSGLEVSPVGLNNILPAIGNYPSLSTEQLKALMTDELEIQMNQESNLRIELKGRKDERGVIWVYPEVTIYEIILSKISATNESGQVISTMDENVFFPGISSFHFIGAKTN